MLKCVSVIFLITIILFSYVLVRFNLGRNTASLLSRICVTTRNIHSLHFQRMNNQAIMKLDNDNYVGVRSSPLAMYLNVQSDFYVGGVPDFSLINRQVSNEIKSNFVGCITHFEVSS